MDVIWKKPRVFVKPNSDDDGQTIVDEAGVYIIAEKIKSKRIVRYVGMSNSIKNRLVDHCKDDEMNEELKKLIKDKKYDGVVFTYALIGNQDTRKDVEYSVFMHYGGKNLLYNKKEPEGKSIKINYPTEFVKYEK